jgi:acyl-CoA thioester hydrolase
MGDVFTHRVLPQFYDFDPLRIAHNVVYIRWLEDARKAFVDASPLPMDRCWAADLSPALTGTEIRYQRPIRYGDPVDLRLWVTRAGRSAWALAFEFVRPETGIVFATGSQTGCFVHPSDGRPAPMPREFLVFCRGFLKDTADTPGA